jgi:hypothetical protein
MADPLLTSLFERARDQYDGAVRWSTLAVVVLLAFHVLFFTHFIELERRVQESGLRFAGLAGARDTAEAVSTKLEQLHKGTEARLTARLDRTLRDLKEDLSRLSFRVREIRTGEVPPSTVAPPGLQPVPREGSDPSDTPYSRGSGSGPDPRLQAAPPTDTALQFQELQASRDPRSGPPPGYEPLEIEIDNDLAGKIRATGDIVAIRDLLRPTVDTQVVAPRFAELNQNWQSRLLPRVREQATEVIEALDAAKRDLPVETARWNEAEKSVNAALQSAKDLRFRPPDEPFWTSEERKDLLFLHIQLSAKAALRQFSANGVFVDELEQAAERQKAHLQDLRKDLAKLETQFRQQKEQLSLYGTSLEALPLDLATAVARFPLAIGVVLLALWSWQASRLRELASLVAALAERDPATAARPWLLSRLSGASQAAGGARSMVPSLGLTALAWIWIGLASWELASWQQAGPGAAILQGALAAAAVAAAQLYRWHVVEKALKALAPPPTAPGRG